uniref:Polyprotein P1234 n=1 Tax=Venezuelan equine encephalitis virus TaxID=11036 RepID=M1KFM3_EEVV|nr:non-structural polyprotein precursor P1234 [Venezuelan equine encephalitis virus]
MEKVHVDIEEDSPFLRALQRSFPQFEVEAKQVTDNDHANARAFSHLASKLIETEVEPSDTILDIGSAPARRMYSKHKYHCICPMKCAEDPDRLFKYAAKLKKNCKEITDKELDKKMKELAEVMSDPDLETETICLHDDETCRFEGQVAVYQDVYAVDGPTSLYHQANKGVRVAYWIGFDTTPFMFKNLAGAYPSYSTNWADETVLTARNIGLCSSDVMERSRRGMSILRKKFLKPSNNVLFSVGSTIYHEKRDLLRSWHLPSVFHLRGKQNYTCRCETIVSCDGYVVKRIAISPGLYGKPSGYAATMHREGFLCCKVTDTLNGERVSFPVCTYVPATLCDQMTGILATDVSADDAQKLLVGLNQRIVVNGRTQRNTNTMKNYLLPVVAQAFARWAKEYKEDQEDERPLGLRDRQLVMGCCWAFRKHKITSVYKRPDTQTIIKVNSDFHSFVLPRIGSSTLEIGLRTRIRKLLEEPVDRPPLITADDIQEAKNAADEAKEVKEAEELRAALPPLSADVEEPALEADVDLMLQEAGAGSVETPRGLIKVTSYAGEDKIGSYAVLSPQAVLRSEKLTCIHPLAEQVIVITHSGRKGRYAVEPYHGKVVVPEGQAIPVQDFQALSESATIVYNEREFVNRYLHHIATHGGALNTDEEYYRVVKPSEHEGEYLYDIDKKQCVKKELVSGLGLTGELVDPPFHEFAYESLRTRPAAPYQVPTIGVYGVPGSGKSGIIKSAVTKKDLVVSAKKENCAEIIRDVKKMKGLDVNARTVDSVLLNGCKHPVETLYIDEAFACHAGTLRALIAIIRPKKAVLCGDPKQCGFFNMMCLKVHFNHEICTQVFHKSISRRCTKSVTSVVSTLFYDKRMRTTNPRDSKIEIDTTGSTKPKKDDLILTCFRGWVKQLQIDYKGNEIMTAAASQGLTRKGVYAVRYKVNENPLYAPTSEHVNVLLTRTEDKIVWKTLAGDPWIKTLTAKYPGDFTATMEEWQAEHDAIMRHILEKPDPTDVFQNKANVCWAKALVPVLKTAGIDLTTEQWNTVDYFKEDKAHSAEIVLNQLCVRFFGLDLDSGLFSAPTVPLSIRNNHWDNSPSPNMYGLNHEVVRQLSRRYPQLPRAVTTGRVYDMNTGTLRNYDPRINLVPVNRRLPHALVTQHADHPPSDFSAFVSKLKGRTVLVVGEKMSISGKTVDWLSDTPDSTFRARLDLGIPNELPKYDIVFVNVRTQYRYHHYQQCEDHAIKLSMLTKKACLHLNPGGTCVSIGYGYADRASESIIGAVARQFKFSRVCKPKVSKEETEVLFVFIGFDRKTRTHNPYKLSSTLTNIYTGSRLHEAGCAPSYHVVRGDIATAMEGVIVNAANSKGQPGSGVCGALYRKYPESFDLQPIEVGKARLVKGNSKHLIHAVGPNFNKVSEVEGDKQLAEAYESIAKIINDNNYRSVAIPLLSTGIFAGNKDRLMQSLNHLLTALDTTDADVAIYCRDKKWEVTLKEVVARREAVEEICISEDSSVAEPDAELVRVHPKSSLAGRKGYSTSDGKTFSYLEGTKFHQAAKDMAEINAMWPTATEANEQVCLYILGESMSSIRSKCPVEESEASTPPSTLPCLCIHAMTPERVQRLKASRPEQITVCSSFPLPKYRITGVQKIQCSHPILFSPKVPEYIHPRKYLADAASASNEAAESTSVDVQPQVEESPENTEQPVEEEDSISVLSEDAPNQVHQVEADVHHFSASAQSSSWSIPCASDFDVESLSVLESLGASDAISMESSSNETALALRTIFRTPPIPRPRVQSTSTDVDSISALESCDSTSDARSIGSSSETDVSIFDKGLEFLARPVPAPRTIFRTPPVPKPRVRRPLHPLASRSSSRSSLASNPPGVNRVITREEFEAFVAQQQRRFDAGAYIFSSDTGQGHLQQKSVRQTVLSEVVLERTELEISYAPRLDLNKEEILRKKLQLNPTQANRSRYQSRRVENMKAITTKRILQGLGHYLKSEGKVECYRTLHPVPLYSASVNRAFSSPKVAVEACNVVLKENFPTVASYCIIPEYDAYLDMVDGASCCLDTASFCPAKLRSFPKKHAYLEPTIRSAVPSAIQNTLQNVLAAATKRNCNVTQMRELPVLDSAAFNVECFKKYACNNEYWETYKKNPIRLTEENVVNYITKLKGPKAAALYAKTHNLDMLQDIPMDRFIMDLKRDVKVTPGTKHTEERPKVQVIQAADPLATAYLCGIHRELVRRLNAVLLPNIHTLFDMSAEDFDAIIAEHFQPGDWVLETDIASFDKSEDDAMALTALMILEDLGVDPELLTLIEAAFGEISSIHLPTKTKFRFGAMMKSGMFLTLFVNTVINMVIASRVLRERLTNSPCAAFIGDDNIVKGVKSDKLMADRCATWLNMEVKIIDAVVGEKAPYFCGGFILCDSVTGTACRVADPLKRLFKLGKPLAVDDEHDDDRRRALQEESARWNRVGIFSELCKAVESRYETVGTAVIIMAMTTLAISVESFSCLRGAPISLYG